MAIVAFWPPAFFRPTCGAQRLLSLVIFSVYLVAGFDGSKTADGEKQVFYALRLIQPAVFGEMNSVPLRLQSALQKISSR